jgi:xylem cysteine proteinase
MNKSISIAFIAMLAAVALYNTELTSQVNEVPQEVVIAFNQWKMTQKRLYASPKEETHRLNVFYANYKKVEEVNSQKLSYTFGLNDFADMSHEEFMAKFQMKAREVEKNPKGSHVVTMEELKEKTDILKQNPDFDNNWCGPPYNACSAVRLQGNCAAGYAFSGAKVLEYAFNAAGRGNNKWLSVQEGVDCTGNFGNLGCGGGYITGLLQYTTYYGLNYDQNYPYVDRQTSCMPFSKQFIPRTYNVIPAGNNDMMVEALKKNPISVALDASQLQFYRSGIYNGACSNTRITHFMTAIGYGTSQGVDYWRLENSWGTNWGMGGYMFMKRNSGFNYSPCGISQQAVFPTL